MAKLYRRHDRLHPLSVISVTIPTSLYFVIPDFITIGSMARLLLLIYSKIFNTILMIIDQIVYE
jgi:hypothetical protein